MADGDPAGTADAAASEASRRVTAGWRSLRDRRRTRLSAGLAVGSFAFAVGMAVATGPLGSVVGGVIALALVGGASVPLAVALGTATVLGTAPTPTAVDAVVFGTGTGVLLAGSVESRQFTLLAVGAFAAFGSVVGAALEATALWVAAMALVGAVSLASYAVYRYSLVDLGLVEVAR